MILLPFLKTINVQVQIYNPKPHTIKIRFFISKFEKKIYRNIFQRTFINSEQTTFLCSDQYPSYIFMINLNLLIIKDIRKLITLAVVLTGITTFIETKSQCIIIC